METNAAKYARMSKLTVAEWRMCYEMEATAQQIKSNIRPKRLLVGQREFIVLKARQTIERMNEIIAKVS
jgi:hypothetical protein